MQRLALFALATVVSVTACKKDTPAERAPTEREPGPVTRLTSESDGAPDQIVKGLGHRPVTRLTFESDGDLDQVVKVLRERLDALDDIEAEVRRDGDVVIVDLGPLPEDRFDGVRQLIIRPGGFALHTVEPDSPLLEALASRASGDIRAETEGRYGRPSITARYLVGPDQATLATFVDQTLTDLDQAPPTDQVLLYGPVHTPPDSRRDPPPWRTYLAARQPALTGADVRDVQVTTNQHTNRTELVVTFADADRLHQVTRDHVGRKLAIVVEGHVKMAPIVREPIPDGRVVITLGSGDPDTVAREARDLALVLRTGSLPAPLRHLSTAHVGSP